MRRRLDRAQPAGLRADRLQGDFFESGGEGARDHLGAEDAEARRLQRLRELEARQRDPAQRQADQQREELQAARRGRRQRRAEEAEAADAADAIDKEEVEEEVEAEGDGVHGELRPDDALREQPLRDRLHPQRRQDVPDRVARILPGELHRIAGARGVDGAAAVTGAGGRARRRHGLVHAQRLIARKQAHDWRRREPEPANHHRCHHRQQGPSLQPQIGQPLVACPKRLRGEHVDRVGDASLEDRQRQYHPKQGKRSRIQVDGSGVSTEGQVAEHRLVRQHLRRAQA